MIEFVRSVFRGLFTFVIVISVIGVVIFGFTVFDDSILTGLLIIAGGFIGVVYLGGFIATILNIDENLKRIAENTSNMNNFHLQGSSSTNTSDNRPLQTVPIFTKIDNDVEKKRCQKCNALVPADVLSCPKCGGDSFI